MARENTQFEREPHPPAYGNGLAPTYFAGTAPRLDVPYSKGAKIIGTIMVIGFALIIVWFVVSYILAQS